MGGQGKARALVAGVGEQGNDREDTLKVHYYGGCLFQYGRGMNKVMTNEFLMVNMKNKCTNSSTISLYGDEFYHYCRQLDSHYTLTFAEWMFS